MGRADEAGRAAFAAVLADCEEEGAEVRLSLNGTASAFRDPAILAQRWGRIAVSRNRPV